MIVLRYRELIWLALSFFYVTAAWPGFAEPAPWGVAVSLPEVRQVWPADSPDGKGRTGSVLGMEVTRQAVLMAARDELGLMTRDVSLGESIEQDGVYALSLGLEMMFEDGSYITLHHGDGRLLEQKIEAPWNHYNGIVNAVINHEAFARTDLARALREAGLRGEPNHWLNQAGVPEEIQALADELSLIPQYRAARSLHKLIREEGESPERLWMLSRVYANLAQESRWFIRCEYAVFQARSLLYAQRLRAKAPDHPLGDLAMAYAWTLATYTHSGDHYLGKLEAIEDIDQKPWAPWAKLLRACCEYDQEVLDVFIEGDTPLAAIAALWGVVTNEFVYMDYMTYGASDLALKVNPDSVRNYYGAFNSMGLSAGRHLTQAAPDLFGRVTARHLDQIHDAPPSVNALLQELDGRPLSLQGLAELGWAFEDLVAEGKDSEELSYAVLGTLIGEANALHVLYRANFIRNTWSVDSTDYFRQVAPALSRHPFKPLLMTFQYPRKSTSEGMRGWMRHFDPGYVNIYHMGVFSKHLNEDFTFANGTNKSAWWLEAQWMWGMSGSEWLYRIPIWRSDYREGRADFARRMQVYDPHHPKRIAYWVINSEATEAQRENLVERYGHHLIVADAIAIHLASEGQIEEAVEYAERVANASPEKQTIERLASLELLLGNEDRWLDLMEKALQLPDFGLDHANINRTIAHTFMNAGRYEAALPYAKASARSGAYWAYEVALYTHLCLGNYKQAEQYARRIDRRYNEDQVYWAAYCLWAGRGDLDTAVELFHELISQEHADDPTTFHITYGWKLIQAGRFEEALQLILDSEKLGEISTRELINGVCLSHQLGRDEDRDRLLSKLIQYPLVRGERLRFCLLGDIFQAILDGNPFDPEALEAWHVVHDDKDKTQGTMYVGWFLMANGDHENGLPLLRTLAIYPGINRTFTNEARAVLRCEGYDNTDMRPTGFHQAHAWPDPN